MSNFALPSRERMAARAAGITREHLQVIWSELNASKDNALEIFRLIVLGQLEARAGREPAPEFSDKSVARAWDIFSNMSDGTIRMLSRLTEILIAARATERSKAGRPPGAGLDSQPEEGDSING